MFKTADYDEDGYSAFLLNKSKESFFTLEDKKYTLLDMATDKDFSMMSKEQKEQYLKSMVSKTEECLIGGEKYGVKYIS